jgi:ParB-like chromosome segregation protein Spo0J
MKVKIKDIKRGQNDRQIDSPALEEAAISKLAESIDSEGLLQEPIVTEPGLFPGWAWRKRVR